MKFIKQTIEGVWLIEHDPHQDHRGSLSRIFCQREYKRTGLNASIVQTNISINKSKHTLRGFHYQVPPFGEFKTLTVINGGIYNIVVDIRKESPTFKKWIAFELNDSKLQSLQIPAGCANAFLTTTDNTIIHYYMSEFYEPESYRGFRYNDPSFDFAWPNPPAVISEKDLNYPDF